MPAYIPLKHTLAKIPPHSGVLMLTAWDPTVIQNLLDVWECSIQNESIYQIPWWKPCKASQIGALSLVQCWVLNLLMDHIYFVVEIEIITPREAERIWCSEHLLFLIIDTLAIYPDKSNDPSWTYECVASKQASANLTRHRFAFQCIVCPVIFSMQSILKIKIFTGIYCWKNIWGH